MKIFTMLLLFQYMNNTERGRMVSIYPFEAFDEQSCVAASIFVMPKVIWPGEKLVKVTCKEGLEL